MPPSRTGNTCYLHDALQLAFLNDLSLLSMVYRQKSMLESAIVDFKSMNIQNLEEIRVFTVAREES